MFWNPYTEYDDEKIKNKSFLFLLFTLSVFLKIGCNKFKSRNVYKCDILDILLLTQKGILSW